MRDWSQVEDVLVEMAEEDLADTGEVRPCLLAFAGEEPVLAATLRPFAKGAHADPLIELLALVMPLRADRLALSMGARAWSLDDPIPPVLDGEADLRQRVVVMEVVDGAGGSPRRRSVAAPFDLVDGSVRWGDRITEEASVGWVGQTLEEAVRGRDRLRCPLSEVRRQARRCVRLGHDLYLSPRVHERLALTAPRG